MLVVDQHGTLFEVQLGATHAESFVVAQHELYLNSYGAQRGALPMPPGARAGGHMHAMQALDELHAACTLPQKLLTLPSHPHASADESLQPVRKAWNTFAVHDGGVIFAHADSSKLLFAQLPVAEETPCPAFLFGSHSGVCFWIGMGPTSCYGSCSGGFFRCPHPPEPNTCSLATLLFPCPHAAIAAEVLCMVRNTKYLVTGAADGSIKAWALEDGSMLDVYTDPAGSAITALEMMGPLMVRVLLQLRGYMTDSCTHFFARNEQGMRSDQPEQTHEALFLMLALAPAHPAGGSRHLGWLSHCAGHLQQQAHGSESVLCGHGPHHLPSSPGHTRAAVLSSRHHGGARP